MNSAKAGSKTWCVHYDLIVFDHPFVGEVAREEFADSLSIRT